MCKCCVRIVLLLRRVRINFAFGVSLGSGRINGGQR